MSSDRLAPFRHVRDVAIIVAFLTALAMPGLWGLVHPCFDAAAEKRPPKPFPKITARALAAFPAGFEAWFGDHFGFRMQLVRAHARAKLALGVSPSPMVVLGREGWLFYRGERNMESFLRTSPFSEEELRALVTRLEQRRAWLSARGIHYLFVVAPNKEVIYPEFVPARPREMPSRFDQLARAVREHSKVDLLDLRETLLTARETESVPVYFKGDTHWNWHGAYAAYVEIVHRLQRAFPFMKPLSRERLVEEVAVFPGGDLAGMAQMTFPEPDFRVRPRMPRSHPDEPGVPFPPDLAPGRRPRARALDDLAAPRALVMHDSFGEWLIPFLSEHFQRTLYLSTHYLDPAIIEREKPDVVVEEMVERYLMSPSIISSMPATLAVTAQEPRLLRRTVVHRDGRRPNPHVSVKAGSR